ncbi:MAG: biotin/lipoyl-binding protein, partial [Chloroflexota bacterium]|nr:biotin/lipoyl-binding protein [Chloroflexota bacterium]
MSSLLRRAIAALLVVAVAGGVAAFLIIRLEVFQVQEEAPPVTAAVERRDLVSTLAVIGNVEYGNTVALGFGQSGILRDLSVEAGQLVPAGTVLAQLDVIDLERAVDDAASDLQQAELQLAKLLRPADAADVERAELDAQEAQASLDDLRTPVSASDIAAAEAAVISAQMSHDRAVQDLEDLQAGPSALDLLEAESSIASAQASLASAELGLQVLLEEPSIAAMADAEGALESARSSLGGGPEGRGGGGVEQKTHEDLKKK